MKKKYYISIFIVLMSAIFYYNYIVKEGCTCENIVVTGNLEIESKKIGINYCSLLSCALKDDSCLLKLLKIKNIENSAGYDHAYVLLEIIQVKGEDYIEKIVELNFNQSERSNLLEYINAGISNSNTTINRPIKLIKFLSGDKSNHQ